ncbi:MAG: isoprenoid biosynthesis glyoxalase ElbB [Acidobacteria bacterium]|nr:isoprenoid biosynthesis glyoxalase ElbB [Acidobacteriota bacterium]
MKRKRIGVLLSGCGVMDGSEIHEATLTLYFLDKQGADILCMAPDKDQADVVNHVSGNATGEKRSILNEAARIARGKIVDINTVKADELDGIILPGGFGAAKNLCTFAFDGAECRVDEGVARLLREMHDRNKPIGALCIAPAVLARLFGAGVSPELTIGNDAGTAAALEKMGARHKTANTDEIVVDIKNKIVTTPCYMTAQSIKEVGAGAEKLVSKILDLAG